MGFEQWRQEAVVIKMTNQPLIGSMAFDSSSKVRWLDTCKVDAKRFGQILHVTEITLNYSRGPRQQKSMEGLRSEQLSWPFKDSTVASLSTIRSSSPALTTRKQQPD